MPCQRKPAAVSGACALRIRGEACVKQSVRSPHTTTFSRLGGNSVPYSMLFRIDKVLPHKREMARITPKCSHHFPKEEFPKSGSGLVLKNSAGHYFTPMR